MVFNEFIEVIFDKLVEAILRCITVFYHMIIIEILLGRIYKCFREEGYKYPKRFCKCSQAHKPPGLGYLSNGYDIYKPEIK